MSILEIQGLAKKFYLHHADREIRSCQNIHFVLEEGEFIGIVGRSGAGKSTILKCIHRTYLPTEGDIIYDSLAYGKISLVHASERERSSICGTMRLDMFPSFSVSCPEPLQKNMSCRHYWKRDMTAARHRKKLRKC